MSGMCSEPPRSSSARPSGIGAAEVLLAVSPALALLAPALFVTCREMLRAAVLAAAGMVAGEGELNRAEFRDWEQHAPLTAGSVGEASGPQDFHPRLWGLPVVLAAPRSAPWAGRLCEGDVIVEVDFHGAPSPAGLERALEGARSVEIVPAGNVREGLSQTVYTADPRRCRVG